ncbi:hypothetical protein BDF20DRAFT_900586 [Mycotypha africana]|uniref:uncharacterized protein n=1 Tax=Mycotypha africana TaxID=64632 RepID=UPI002300D53E|nr:uncharacterized protein BDF20DRAFT_900586 [Mycotypha africana]KAI8967351.1 hypothetical protein BDF20DRAFT_900586 [Mycotypha africana]
MTNVDHFFFSICFLLCTYKYEVLFFFFSFFLIQFKRKTSVIYPCLGFIIGVYILLSFIFFYTAFF